LPLANLRAGALSPLVTCFGIGAVVRRDKPSHDVTLAGAAVQICHMADVCCGSWP
jgi:hypothetical protein